MVRSISAIDADTTLALVESPLNGVYDETINKDHQETEEMEMVAPPFFFGKFQFDGWFILGDGWVVVIRVSRRRFSHGGFEVAAEGDAVSACPISALIVRCRIIRWKGPDTGIDKILPFLVPFAGSISIFSPKPTREVPIIEVEAEEGHGVEPSAVMTETSRNWQASFQTERGNRVSASVPAEVGVEMPFSTHPRCSPSFPWGQECPNMVDHTDRIWSVICA